GAAPTPGIIVDGGRRRWCGSGLGRQAKPLFYLARMQKEVAVGGGTAARGVASARQARTRLTPAVPFTRLTGAFTGESGHPPVARECPLMKSVRRAFLLAPPLFVLALAAPSGAQDKEKPKPAPAAARAFSP